MWPMIKIREEVKCNMKEKLNRVCKKIFILPAWLTVLIAVPSFLALVWFFLKGKTMEFATIFEIPMYCLSAYALIIVCTLVGRISIRTNRKLNTLPLWIRWKEDARFHTMVSIVPSLLLNFVYVITNVSVSVKNHAVWFAYLGIYYLLLTLMKSYLLHGLVFGKGLVDEKRELRKYRNCGISLLLMNMILSSVSAYIVEKNQNYHYDGMLIYVMAAVAFYSIITAVINLIRYRRLNSPILSAVKVINLTVAMVTLLALETAMISQFGQADGENFRRIMTSLTSGVVCFIEFIFAIYMIWNGTRNMKRLKN